MQPGIPKDTVAEIRVPEVERRQNHINKIDPSHPLLQIALDCLKDEDVERPSAQQLCDRVAALKEDQKYGESVTDAQEISTPERSGKKGTREQHAEAMQNMKESLRQKDLVIAIKQLQIERLTGDYKGQQLQDSERMIAQLRRQIDELKQLRTGTPKQNGSKEKEESLDVVGQD